MATSPSEEIAQAGSRVLRPLRSRLRRGLPVGCDQGADDGPCAEDALLVAVAAPITCCAPLAAPVLDEAEAAATAELFRALSDPSRVRIVNILAGADGQVCACEFEPALGLSQPTVSHHLKKLTDAGLIEREQRGKWAYFSLNRDAVDKLAAIADLKGACC
jgi:ArsR family transcriptional regulator, arsenate/arsenite/antimonite-responsive transcriptional repressor